MDMKRNTVSIVMCTYNGESFIREQLDSIMAQTYPVEEIIIQDDCSTDGTFEVVSEYASRYPHIRPIRNKTRKGVNGNFFDALGKASGDYIAIADQDDIWEPYKIKRQMQAIGDKLMCASFSQPFYGDGKDYAFDSRVPNCSLLRMIYVGIFPGHSTVFSRRLLSLMPDPAPIAVYRCYDLILALTAAAFDSIVFLGEVLSRHRRHASAYTYIVPTSSRKSAGNVFRWLRRTWRLHKELKDTIRLRLSTAEEFLSHIDSEEPVLQKALYMLRLQASLSRLDFFRLQLFCMRNCEYLLYTPPPLQKNFNRLFERILFPDFVQRLFQISQYLPVRLSGGYRRMGNREKDMVCRGETRKCICGKKILNCYFCTHIISVP